MAKKIVNLRLSEEMIDLINQQIGDTFTQKFENMVTRCIWELPAKEQQLKEINELIVKQREQFARQQTAMENLKRMKHNIENAMSCLTVIAKQAKVIADATKET